MWSAIWSASNVVNGVLREHEMSTDALCCFCWNNQLPNRGNNATAHREAAACHRKTLAPAPCLRLDLQQRAALIERLPAADNPQVYDAKRDPRRPQPALNGQRSWFPARSAGGPGPPTGWQLRDQLRQCRRGVKSGGVRRLQPPQPHYGSPASTAGQQRSIIRLLHTGKDNMLWWAAAKPIAGMLLPAAIIFRIQRTARSWIICEAAGSSEPQQTTAEPRRRRLRRRRRRWTRA